MAREGLDREAGRVSVASDGTHAIAFENRRTLSSCILRIEKGPDLVDDVDNGNVVLGVSNRERETVLARARRRVAETNV
ncbi:hypothetical protein [Methylocystis sp. ATCC 49242]|uniref:hypothetical protein n=1 Tax=Methylocystis sp. ATCC 49242 TaxID=622637 RepID=UPI001184D930|nr:hypothetical protein [Methylocystis sp. ATCC 49242]